MLRKCRDWAGEIGEIKVTEDTQPGDLDPGHRRRHRADPGERARPTTTPATAGKKIRETAVRAAGHCTTAAGSFIDLRRSAGAARGARSRSLYENVREMTRRPSCRVARAPGRVVHRLPVRRRQLAPGRRSGTAGRVSRRRHADAGVAAVVPQPQGPGRPRPPTSCSTTSCRANASTSTPAHLSVVDRAQARALAQNQRDSAAQRAASAAWRWPTGSAPSRAMR
ncbi:MAG: hypothetical protein MZW92_66100 [Comamonadaceae bacterium]|nr:hypothetical protein [Comamonadaceae bacterium]